MRSLRRTLTLSVAASLIPVVAVLAALTYFVVEHQLRRQVDEALVATANALTSVIERDPDEPSGYELEFDPTLAPEFSSGGAYFEVWLPDGTVRGKSESLGEVDLPRLEGTMRDPAFESMRLPGGRPGRIVHYAFWPRVDADYGSEALEGQVAITVARDTTSLERTLTMVAAWSWGLGILGILLAGAAVRSCVRRGLRPLDGLATEIERIDDVRLDTRVDASRYPPELTVPIAKLNGLLTRLQDAFARERRLTADLAHELRTPLAALRNVLEVAASRPRTAGEYQAALDNAHAITRAMIATGENLLALTRAEAGQVETRCVAADLHALVDECWAPYAAAASGRRLEFHNDVPVDARLTTDREKLRIVLHNLLSNAVAYTQEGGTIWVEVPRAEHEVLAVTDSGPPIPAEDLERVFDRFWRGDQARTAAGTHAGIGLSLVRALCGTLGFTIAAANTSEGGVRFAISRRHDPPRA